jgi:hypothetical protein
MFLLFMFLSTVTKNIQSVQIKILKSYPYKLMLKTVGIGMYRYNCRHAEVYVSRKP